MIFLCIPLCILFGMLGGQINKLFRPIGISLSIFLIYLIWHNHSWLYGLPSLLYGLELTLGYGENSLFMKWFKNDENIRDFYSFICCIPVIISMVLTKNIFSVFGILLIIISFQLRLGSFGKIGKYDILPEDIFRWGSVGLAMSLALI